MNLYFRLLWLTLTARTRTKIDIFDPCLTTYRCWPTDLDVLRHMTNSKYFACMDLARVDYLKRAGLADAVTKAKLYPVVVAETMRFKRSIQLFERFTIETRILGWDDKAFLVGQRFLREDRAVAEGVVRARFLKISGGPVSPEEILKLGGVTKDSLALEDWVARWNAAQQ